MTLIAVGMVLMMAFALVAVALFAEDDERGLAPVAVAGKSDTRSMEDLFDADLAPSWSR